MNPTVDVVDDYDADPTGVNPADADIQRAIDENPHIKIFIPPGTFKITKTIDVRSWTHIFGYDAGMHFKLPSILNCDPGVTAFNFHDNPQGDGGAHPWRVRGQLAKHNVPAYYLR